MGWLKTFKPSAIMPTDDFEFSFFICCRSILAAVFFGIVWLLFFLVCNVAGRVVAPADDCITSFLKS